MMPNLHIVVCHNDVGFSGTHFVQLVTIFSQGWVYIFDPDEIGAAFHWAGTINPATRGAPTAGFSFHYDPVYDGISASLQQAWTNKIDIAAPEE